MDYFSGPSIDDFPGPSSLSFGENITCYQDTVQDSKEEDSLSSFVIGSSTNHSSHRRGMRGPIDERILRKGTWNPEEDKIVLEHVRKYGAKDWNIIPSSGLLLRSGKSCRDRWLSKLRPGLKSGVKFSADEVRLVQDTQQEIGNKWSKIAAKLPGRTDNDVKNFFYNDLKKKSRQKNKNIAFLRLPEFGPELSIPCGEKSSIPCGEKQSCTYLGEKSFINDKTVKRTSDVCQHEPSNGAQLEKPDYANRENSVIVDTQDFTWIAQPMTFVTPQRENDPRSVHVLTSSVAQPEKPFYDFTQVVPLNSLFSDHEFGDYVLFPELGGITFAEDCKHPLEVLQSSDIDHEEIEENISNSREIDSFFNDLPDLF